MVAADTDVIAGVELGAALTNDDAASVDHGVTENLDAEALCLRVFYVLFKKSLLKLSLDLDDLDFRVVLTVAGALHGVLAAAELENADLVGAAVMGHDSGHGSTFHDGGTDLKAFFGAHSEHFVENHFAFNVGVEGFDLEKITFGNAVLLAAGLDNCVHVVFPRRFAPGFPVGKTFL